MDGKPALIPRTAECASRRTELETFPGSDLDIITAESDWITGTFGARNGVSTNDFRALILVILAEARGQRLTAGRLRQQMGLSGAAITYLIERMSDEGYLRKEADPIDRHKTIVRYSETGMELAHALLRGIN
jgi:DNA-binding MarR family transcriptional regulator